MATIQEVYIALFGRPADPAGLAYYIEATNDGANLDAVGDLSASEEYTDRFEGFNNNQKVTQIYQDLFNRSPDAAGLAFYVNLLNTGAATEQDIAIRILDGATGDDAEIIANKVEAANAFTASIDTATEIGAYVGEDAAEAGRQFLDGITSDDDTIPDQAAIDAAIADIEAGVGTGDTFTLGGGVDDITGTAGGDTFNATTLNTLQSTDTINGGQSVDVLNATITGTVAPTLNSVENVFLTDGGAGFGIDLEDATGVQQVWSVAQDNTFTVVNAKAGTTFGVQNAADAETYSIGFDDDELDDDATLRLALNDTNNFTISFTSGDNGDIDAIEISVMSDDNNADLTALTNAEDVTVTGEGELTLAIGSGTEDFDSTGFDGDVALTVGGAEVDIMFGAGDDVIAAAGTADVTADGGAGNDVLRASGGNGITSDLDGGDGDDILGGSVGGSSELTGGAGNDEFHFSNTMTGVAATDINTVTDFTSGEDVISLLKIAGFFGSSFEDGIVGNSDLAADDYVELGGFGDFDGTVHADGLVVFNTGFANQTAITNQSNALAGADAGEAFYFMAFNEEEEMAQLYYDGLTGAGGAPVLLANFENITTEAQLQGLSRADFDIYTA
ncbi:hypothetical protein GCM10007989_12050 [Devosia pacifica]|uniref:DUF4214 domain-containing protein n=1 Tax=Devosia pacifica TaxID=1335967 RepID=A0A918VS70_9HYPH|nr:DUF4214 domain-containing protein [Devosia pacifica]GHA18345.1 hypothetical protein GCM10007989_12050 [Devosia pacifica]